VAVPAHHNLDDRTRELVERTVPPGKLFPGVEPVFVDRLAYLFGVGSLAAFVWLVVTGLVLTAMGPDWFHGSGTGLFVNSLHFWGVQLFFVFMVAHLVVQFVTGSYRGRRRATWVIGALAYFAAITTAFTGFLSQSNFESQWIATQGKDAFNSLGIGWLLNLMNSGQMLTIHVALLPLVVAIVVAVHVLLVRHIGICPPYDARDEHLGELDAEGAG
jgi:ubiquinol-cytochrome c reductase cytochrome b subunit